LNSPCLPALSLIPVKSMLSCFGDTTTEPQSGDGRLERQSSRFLCGAIVESWLCTVQTNDDAYVFTPARRGTRITQDRPLGNDIPVRVGPAKMRSSRRIIHDWYSYAAGRFGSASAAPHPGACRRLVVATVFTTLSRKRRWPVKTCSLAHRK